MEPEGSSPHSQAPATCPYPYLYTYLNACLLHGAESFLKS